MNDLFKESILSGAIPYTQRGVHLSPASIEVKRKLILQNIMRGLNKAQKQIFKLLWGYYRGKIFNQQEIANLLSMTVRQVRDLEHQSYLIAFRPERLTLFRELYEVSN